jgi:hypothetical protein
MSGAKPLKNTGLALYTLPVGRYRVKQSTTLNM